MSLDDYYQFGNVSLKFLVDSDDYELFEIENKIPIKVFRNPNDNKLVFYVEITAQEACYFIYKHKEFRIYYNTEFNMLTLTFK
jgi:hypothetical protein